MLSDERAESKEFSVDSVEHCLKEITFSRVFRVEQVEQLEHESLINVLFADGRLEVWRFEEAKEEFVDELEKLIF